MDYIVLEQGVAIGSAQILRQGMTLVIRCKVSKEGRGEVYMVGKFGSLHLGSCYPYEAVKRIGAKDIDLEKVRFEVMGQSAPVDENAPFLAIDRLAAARYDPVKQRILFDQVTSD